MTDRVGIVVVSHSAPLADAAVDLAMQMVADDPPPVAVAAGADGGLGTDAMAVLEAIESVAGPAGVLVLMDLGSAVLSAETALEFVDPDTLVRLTAAPLVEGVVAAVVQAGLGSDLDAVTAEAEAALRAKQAHLGDDAAPTEDASAPAAAPAAPVPDASAEVQLVNKDGLHARPAAAVASATEGVEATVTVTNLTTGTGPVAATSAIELMTLGALPGHRVRFAAIGPDADDAVTTLVELASSAFGEPVVIDG